MVVNQIIALDATIIIICLQKSILFHSQAFWRTCRRGNISPLFAELAAFQGKIEESRLYSSILGRCSEGIEREMLMNSLKVPLIAERALIYLYAEQNLLSEEQMRFFIQKLDLDRDYLSKRLADNRRPLAL